MYVLNLGVKGSRSLLRSDAIYFRRCVCLLFASIHLLKTGDECIDVTRDVPTMPNSASSLFISCSGKKKKVLWEQTAKKSETCWRKNWSSKKLDKSNWFTSTKRGRGFSHARHGTGCGHRGVGGSAIPDTVQGVEPYSTRCRVWS